jgi:AcrR family transcriptional regulator
MHPEERIMTPAQPAASRQTRRKQRTRQAIQDAALQLIIDHGYDATTCEQIAEHADVAPATFYRHFATKEDVVLTDDYDQLIANLLRAQPPTDPIGTKIRAAFLDGIRHVWDNDQDTLRTRSELIVRTAKLRSRQWEQRRTTVDMIVEALAGPTTDTDPFTCRVIANATIAAMVTAIEQWIDSPRETVLADVVTRAFDLL